MTFVLIHVFISVRKHSEVGKASLFLFSKLVKYSFHLKTSFFTAFEFGVSKIKIIHYFLSGSWRLSYRQWRSQWVPQLESCSQTVKDSAFGVLCPCPPYQCSSGLDASEPPGARRLLDFVIL